MKLLQAGKVIGGSVERSRPWTPCSMSFAMAGSFPCATQGSIRSKVAPSQPMIKTLLIGSVPREDSRSQDPRRRPSVEARARFERRRRARGPRPPARSVDVTERSESLPDHLRLFVGERLSRLARAGLVGRGGDRLGELS